MNLTRKNFACERQDVPASSPQLRLDLRDARSRPLRSLPSGRFSRNHDPVRIQTVFHPSGELRFPGSCNDALAQVPSPALRQIRKASHTSAFTSPKCVGASSICSPSRPGLASIDAPQRTSVCHFHTTCTRAQQLPHERPARDSRFGPLPKALPHGRRAGTKTQPDARSPGLPSRLAAGLDSASLSAPIRKPLIFLALQHVRGHSPIAGTQIALCTATGLTGQVMQARDDDNAFELRSADAAATDSGRADR